MNEIDVELMPQDLVKEYEEETEQKKLMVTSDSEINDENEVCRFEQKDKQENTK